MSSPPSKPGAIKGRGIQSNREGRFESTQVEAFDDGWFQEHDGPARPATEVRVETAKSIISENQSPDLPFDLSLNPYRGCEHGCSYCYARPSHGYLNLSAGLDFETKLFAKTNAADLLRQELRKRSHKVSAINFGANTDPYQPIERTYQITRQCLQVLLECRHPLTIITKNALVERDLDLLKPLAELDLVQVFLSVTSLDNRLSAKLEPRATAPHRRIEAIRRLNAAGVPTGVFVAPIIPMITDRDLEAILEAAADAGARHASYTLVRLPHEVKELFREWLATHFPDRAEHVMHRIQDIRGGKDYDARFFHRMKGQGVFGELIRQRFDIACRKFGLDRREQSQLRTDLFQPPARAGDQGDLFGGT